MDLKGKGVEGRLVVTIRRLSQLVELDVSQNKFRGELPVDLKQLTLLTKLNVEGNSFSKLSKELCEFLSNLKSGDCKLGGNPWTALPDCVPTACGANVAPVTTPKPSGGGDDFPWVIVIVVIVVGVLLLIAIYCLYKRNKNLKEQLADPYSDGPRNAQQQLARSY